MRNVGGSGLNVYDSTGRLLGPLIGIGETIITIGTKKYWTIFTDNSLGIPFNTIIFSGPNCTGTAYTSNFPLDQFSPQSGFEQYSGVGTLGVDTDGQLWLTGGSLLNSVSYGSYRRQGFSCTNGQLVGTPFLSSLYTVTPAEPSLGNVVLPLDVH